MRRRHVYLWTAAAAALCVCANWPTSIKLGNFLRVAGFPLPFVMWVNGRAEQFDPVALAVDVALAAAVVTGVAYVCARRAAKAEAAPAPGAGGGNQ